MTRADVCRHIREVGILPAIRVTSRDDAFFVADTILGGGIPIVEVTMTVPGALDVVSSLRARHPHAIIGSGTVLDASTARNCMEAGAMFITSPGFDARIVEATHQTDTAAFPGALTPSEIMAANSAGADMIKIFPCAQIGGSAYIRALHAPFPNTPLIASGGVHQQTAMAFLEAGAAAIGVGEDLIPHEAVQSRKVEWIQELAHRFIGMVQRARAAH